MHQNVFKMRCGASIARALLSVPRSRFHGRWVMLPGADDRSAGTAVRHGPGFDRRCRRDVIEAPSSSFGRWRTVGEDEKLEDIKKIFDDLRNGHVEGRSAPDFQN
ncbi:hypothetical protein GDI0344 [Gluconacetobacter diazotrophicus PA1 5]|uniref:Uncharacterized protein n=1 Tax=Gluconacetobacter diazotrophicus (strain ATCC 49037 / DSM 5601 / CCUG 37298 / CIP 103539 / LMG 7603 / PAl5) TaxID=272568 RepID=A9H546_GLUDA|nr:hypothetical protein GDI0344 [Gluconacetobacter diazotrophicus PA1 5]